MNGWGDSPNTEFGSFGGCWSFAGTRSATSGAEVHTHNEDLVAVESLPTILGYGVMLAVSYVGNDISRCRARDLKRASRGAMRQRIGDMLC